MVRRAQAVDQGQDGSQANDEGNTDAVKSDVERELVALDATSLPVGMPVALLGVHGSLAPAAGIITAVNFDADGNAVSVKATVFPADNSESEMRNGVLVSASAKNANEYMADHPEAIVCFLPEKP